MTRRYFGTDGVRGVVGDTLTVDIVERLGRAATLWAGGGRVLVGRDTRGSGPELESALARGIADGGGAAVLGGVLPTPAVALLAEGLGVVVSASHNPPEYNGVKVFAQGGRKLADDEEAAIERLLDRPGPGSGSVAQVDGLGVAYADLVVDRFGRDLSGLRIAVDCANGAFSAIAPRVLRRLGAEVVALYDEPDGANINVGCGATDLAALSAAVLDATADLGVAFDGDGDRMLAVDERGELIDGDQILAVLALAQRVERVAVTVMTNLGFHRLMAAEGIAVDVTPVGDRYVLESLRATGGVLGGEQSGHLIWLDGHVTGDGLVAAVLLCGALDGRPLSEAAAVMERHPQVVESVHVARRELTEAVEAEVARLNAELGDHGRVLVRPSGTEPVVRVLAEAETEEVAGNLCASIAAIVRTELG
ncbi:MAG: phosphoglucosamine mutase [Thermoleophilia bacterium]|nr:phosphoglucosamine mutase [Thermoleophilia bacterium]